MFKFIKLIRNDDKGATAIEYGQLGNTFNNVSNHMKKG
jgi:hypothetical protein